VDADIISHLTGFQDTAASSSGRYKLREVYVEEKSNKRNLAFLRRPV
jgi:hypothetical protein